MAAAMSLLIGTSPADRHRRDPGGLGLHPVQKVNYTVENTRVKRFDRL